MSELSDKERRALKILRMYRGGDPIEVSYSGGKDSDVILTLTKMAGIPYRAIYKNTTIDPPGTVQHCKDNGVEVVMPKERFFDIVARKGPRHAERGFAAKFSKSIRYLTALCKAFAYVRAPSVPRTMPRTSLLSAVTTRGANTSMSTCLSSTGAIGMWLTSSKLTASSVTRFIIGGGSLTLRNASAV